MDDFRPLKHNFSTIDHLYTMAQDRYRAESRGEVPNGSNTRAVYVIVPNYEELPESVANTIREIGKVNLEASNIDKINFKVRGIILSDQSRPEIAETNEGLLYTVKDYLDRRYRTYMRPPHIYHLVLGKKTDEIMGDYASRFYGDIISGKNEPRGKGWNMLVSSLSTGRYPDEDVAIVYVDAENLQIGPDQIMALGWPLYNRDSPVKYVKANFDRFHMEGRNRSLGGRVNHSAFKPLVDMYYKAGLLPSIGYPLAGEEGIIRATLWSIMISRQYGVEWSKVLQFLCPLFDTSIDLETEFLEVYLGLNMDQPLAEGKDTKTILENIDDMTGQIIGANNNLLGNTIRERWKTEKEFMEDFYMNQESHTKRWSRGFTDDRDQTITGGLSLDELKSHVGEIMNHNMKELYSDGHFDNDLLTPMNNVKAEIGDRLFNEFVGSMTEIRRTIL